MARTSQYPHAITSSHGFELGLEFLRARRAQNLSWMRAVEQSFSSMAEVHKAAPATGDTLGRVWSAQAALVRDTASVCRSVTTHLAR